MNIFWIIYLVLIPIVIGILIAVVSKYAGGFDPHKNKYADENAMMVFFGAMFWPIALCVAIVVGMIWSAWATTAKVLSTIEKS